MTTDSKFMFTNYYFLFAPHSGSGICYPFIKTCVFGSEAKTGLLDDVSVAARSEGDSGSSVRQAIKLIFCAAGLQVGALTKNTVMKYKYKATCDQIPITPMSYVYFCILPSPIFVQCKGGCFMFVFSVVPPAVWWFLFSSLIILNAEERFV